jgi:hypothetical protein
MKLLLCLYFPVSLFGNFQKVIVDSTFDDNQNDFEYYWDYYDDNSRVGKNDRPQVTNPGTPTVINVNSMVIPREAFGDQSDSYKIRMYTFTTGQENGNRFATMPFTYGSPWKTSLGQAQPYVGIFTRLVKPGSSIDLSNMSGIQFKVRSHTNNLILRFKLQTFEIDSISNVPGSNLIGDEFGYYEDSVLTRAGVWSTVTILPKSLKLPGQWARDIPLNLKRCTQLTWEISNIDNENVTIDTFDIDDVIIRGTALPCNQVWNSYESIDMLPSTGLYLNFEPGTLSPVQQNLQWYGFIDKRNRGEKVTITNGTLLDTVNGLFEIPVFDTITGNDTGHVLKVSFNYDTTTGPNIHYTSAGLELDMRRSAQSSYWNASSAGASKIYFHYKADEITKYRVFEVFDDYDSITPVNHSTRINIDGTAARWRCLFPGGDGLWKAVQMPLDSLTICNDWVSGDPEPLHKSKIAKFRWQAVASAGAGSFSIDNIYFPGANLSQTNTVLSSSKTIVHQFKKHLSVVYQKGSIILNGLKGESYSNKLYAVHNSRGQKILHGLIGEQSNIPVRYLPTGMYIISISGHDNLKKYETNLPLLITN